MSEVLFADAHVKELKADATLPAKFGRMLERIDLAGMFGGQTVAVKMHVGAHLGYTTIHPLFVRMLVAAMQRAGATVFLTDGSVAMGEALARGYTQEVLGAPIRGAAGVQDKYFYPKPINYRSLDSVDLCGEIVDADAMLVLSHVKGHGNCGFGGAIKNLAMGCVTCDSRGKIHRLSDAEFRWDGELCNHCYQCRDNCPAHAISFDDQGKMSIFGHHCRYCMHCTRACPTGAVSISTESTRYFQEGMARVTKAVLDTFEVGRVYYLSFLLNITPLCDCWGFTTPALVPDIGIMGSADLVSIEQAALDAVKWENYIPGTLPDQMEMGTEGHLFQRIHRKDPYLQVQTAAEIGLGSREYKLVGVE